MSVQSEWDIVSGVGFTALVVAAGRAIESDRADRLIEDPYAKLLVDAAQSPIDLFGADSDSRWLLSWMSDYMAVRSRYFDDWFHNACAAGVEQAVILAGGLDTRAFRMDWPRGMRLFEIDQPKVLEFKDSVLAEHGATAKCERHTVGIDLRADWQTELVRAGFDNYKPTAWLAEGLLPYLPAEAERALLETVTELSAFGSRMAIEDIAGARERLLDSGLAEYASEWGLNMTSLLSSEDRPAPSEPLRSHGWTTTRQAFEEIANGYGRYLETSGIVDDLASVSHVLTAALRHTDSGGPGIH